MSQVSSKLRRGEGRYFHWCPACEEMHQLPDSWQFNGNLDRPTFTPSFKHDGWVGGKVGVCHYILTDGVLNFCGDCTHSMAGKSVPLPALACNCGADRTGPTAEAHLPTCPESGGLR